MTTTVQIDCDECDGTGKVHSHNDKCWECNGRGRIMVTVEYAAWKERDAKRCKCGLCGPCRRQQEIPPIKYLESSKP